MNLNYLKDKQIIKFEELQNIQEKKSQITGLIHTV